MLSHLPEQNNKNANMVSSPNRHESSITKELTHAKITYESSQERHVLESN